RSIQKHNTININGDETNDFTGVFSVEQKTNVSMSEKNGGIISTHDGYYQKYGVIIERYIKNSDIFTMEDKIDGNIDFSNNIIVSKFHLHREISAKLITPQICQLILSNGEELNFIVDGGIIEIDSAKTSNSYFNYTDILV